MDRGEDSDELESMSSTLGAISAASTDTFYETAQEPVQWNGHRALISTMMPSTATLRFATMGPAVCREVEVM